MQVEQQAIELKLSSEEALRELRVDLEKLLADEVALYSAGEKPSTILCSEAFLLALLVRLAGRWATFEDRKKLYDGDQ